MVYILYFRYNELTMLSAADRDYSSFLYLFSRYGLEVAFLSPTETGFNKSIMDAIKPLRNLLLSKGMHDYDSQLQGPDNKIKIPACFLRGDALDFDTQASLYRPITKQGDPRIWFEKLKTYCVPHNLLAILPANGKLYVFNLSDSSVLRSLEHGEGRKLLEAIRKGYSSVIDELIDRLKDIHKEGFVKGVSRGDTNVGMTLEHMLDIPPNSSKEPDYKGIELKTKRFSFTKPKTLQTLFTCVPDWKSSNTTAKKILDTWGYWADDEIVGRRFNLYCTVSAHVPNSQGLYFEVKENQDLLINYGDKPENKHLFVAQWDMNELRKRLSVKHHETVWISATTELRRDGEYFRFDKVVHTKTPNIQMLGYLLDSGIVTLDYTLHYKPDGNTRDHGYIFRIHPRNMSLLFPNPETIIL